MKTVKELENQLKVSKVSIYSMLKRPEIKAHVFKGESNITLIDDIGVELLKAHYFKEQAETLKDIAAEEIGRNKTDSKAVGKDENEVKNTDIIRILQQQINTKDEQINNLLNIVLNQQKLQATHLLADSQNAVNSSEQPEQPPKESFLKRIFRKK